MCVCDYLSPFALLSLFSETGAGSDEINKDKANKQTNKQNKEKGVGSGRATDKTDRQASKQVGKQLGQIRRSERRKMGNLIAAKGNTSPAVQ